MPSVDKEKFDRDICFDDICGDSLTIPELREGLSYFSKIGKKIDLLYFDACVMGNLEVAYEIRNLAKYLIFSEEMVLGPTRWDLILNYLLTNPYSDSITLGKKIIDIYYNNFINNYITMSLVDLDKIILIAQEIVLFSQYLNNCLPGSAQGMMNLRLNTLHFQPYSDKNFEYADLSHFALNVLNSTSYTDLINSALRVRQYINNAVVYNKTNYADAYGISIWFPYKVEDWNMGLTKFQDLAFFKDGYGMSWAIFLYNFLESYCGKGLANIRE